MIRRNQIALTLGGAALGLAAVAALWFTRGPAPEPAAVVHPALGETVNDAYRSSVLDGASPELKGALGQSGKPNDLPPIDPNLRTVSGTSDPALPPLPDLPGLPTPVLKGEPVDMPSLPPLPPPMPKAD